MFVNGACCLMERCGKRKAEETEDVYYILLMDMRAINHTVKTELLTWNSL